MKNIILVLAMMLVSISTSAQQKVTLKAGTIVPLQNINTVKGGKVEEGETIDFSVTHDVMCDGQVVIPRGTLVKGKVTEARKSTIAGTKGRLSVNIPSLTLPDGTLVFFSNANIIKTGKNRTPLAVVTCLFLWPCIFIPGTGAVLPAGYETQATVASNVEITL